MAYEQTPRAPHHRLIEVNNRGRIHFLQVMPDWIGECLRILRSGVTPAQRAHRLLLRSLMLQHDFSSYPKECWRFTLADAPTRRPGLIFPFGDIVPVE
jgi:hypothetical protein